MVNCTWNLSTPEWAINAGSHRTMRLMVNRRRVRWRYLSLPYFLSWARLLTTSRINGAIRQLCTFGQQLLSRPRPLENTVAFRHGRSASVGVPGRRMECTQGVVSFGQLSESSARGTCYPSQASARSKTSAASRLWLWHWRYNALGWSTTYLGLSETMALCHLRPERLSTAR